MQYFTAFALILSWSASRLQCSDYSSNVITGPLAKLEVWPQTETGLGRKVILRRIDEPLNLTCMAVHQKNENNLSDYIVDWKVPFPMKNRGTRVAQGQVTNSAWLWFEKLAEEDAGDYRCMAVSSNTVRQPPLSIVIHLSVKNKIGYCNPRWFKCRSSRCIMTRYVCDGMADCENGEDESSLAGCGPDPCLGKVYCGQRCLPRNWCCDLGNCSANSQSTRPEPPHPPSTDHQRFGDIGFLQTTIYTVIGCAMAFMFIVTILVIAICRVHMKRAMNSRCPEQLGNPGLRPRHSIPLYDLDVYLNGAADLNHPGGVTVTYNINNGVQFVGRPVEPPPYSEIASVPPREGPPPPYVSRENLLDPPVSEIISSNLNTNASLLVNPQSQMSNQFVNNDDSVVTRIPSSFQNHPNLINNQSFSAGQIPGPQVRPGLNIFNLSLNGDDGSNTTFNTSDSTALNTSSNSDSSSSSSVDNLVIGRNITSHSQNFEPEYTETDSLLIETRSDGQIHNADQVPRSSENHSTFQRPGGNQNIGSISRRMDNAEPLDSRLAYENSNGRRNSGKICKNSNTKNGGPALRNSESESSLAETEHQNSDLRTLGKFEVDKKKNFSTQTSEYIQGGEQMLQRVSSKTALNLSLVGESSENSTTDENSQSAASLPRFVNVNNSLTSELKDLDLSLGCSNAVLQLASSSLIIIDQDLMKPNLVKHDLKSSLVNQGLENKEADATTTAKQSQKCLGKSVWRGNVKNTSVSRENLAKLKEDSQDLENQNSECSFASSNGGDGQRRGISLVSVGDSPVSYSNLSANFTANEISECETEAIDSEQNTPARETQPLVMPLRESFIGLRKES